MRQMRFVLSVVSDGTLGGTRTRGLRVRNPALYPLSYKRTKSNTIIAKVRAEGEI